MHIIDRACGPENYSCISDTTPPFPTESTIAPAPGLAETRLVGIHGLGSALGGIGALAHMHEASLKDRASVRQECGHEIPCPACSGALR